MSFSRKSQDRGRYEQHTIMRLRQRYGIHARISDLSVLASLIGSPRAIPLCFQPPSTYVMEIRWRGRNVVSVWDDSRKTFKTALPMRGQQTVEEYLNELRRHFKW